jgi:3-oxoacyl-[acyl-carrier-protein] synthase-3
MKNTDFEGVIETSDEWIVQRTGIRQRYIAASDETTASLGEAAARAALQNAGLEAEDIDLIVLATSTPNHTFPATAVEIQQRLGLRSGFAFDMQAVCSGFVYALNCADLHIRGGAARRALVDRRRDVLAHPRLAGPLDLRVVRRRRRRRWSIRAEHGGGHRRRPRDAAASLRSDGYHMQQALLSTAAPRPPARSAICAWKAARCSSTPSA